MPYHAFIESSLGRILLCADTPGLSGLYFVGQKDCPRLEGLPVAQGDALQPRAGELDGRPIHQLRVRSGAQPLDGLHGMPMPHGDVVFAATLQIRESHVPAAVKAIFQATLAQLQAYAADRRHVFSIPLDLNQGTAFQQSVWRAMLCIAPGQVVSYGELAQQAGLTAGHGRAVGAAVGRNPVSIIVPCHRVVAANKQLNGYSGGLSRKLQLLQFEGLALAA